jgi:hypothetical protein
VVDGVHYAWFLPAAVKIVSFPERVTLTAAEGRCSRGRVAWALLCTVTGFALVVLACTAACSAMDPLSNSFWVAALLRPQVAEPPGARPSRVHTTSPDTVMAVSRSWPLFLMVAAPSQTALPPAQAMKQCGSQ